MTYTKNTVYKFDPEIEESSERFTLSHTNEYGSAFFSTVGKNEEIDEFMMLSSVEVNDSILIEA